MLKRDKIKSISMLVLIGVLSFSLTFITVHAADHSKHYKTNIFVGMGNHVSNVKYWYSEEGSYYYGYRILQGANGWVNAGLGAGFTKVSSKSESVIRVYSKDYGNTGWIGRHEPWVGHGNIKLNEYYHVSNGGYQVYEEVFAHEMGHAYGLLHYDCADELMKSKGYIGSPNPYTGDKLVIKQKMIKEIRK